MQILANAKANEFLATRGLRIGGWNELLETNANQTSVRQRVVADVKLTHVAEFC